MTAFLIHNMAPLMFASLIVVLLIGYPAAFSLAAVGLIYGLLGIQLGLFHPDFLQALPERVYGIMSNDTLLAIPFFTFMGLILERSGMAEDLLDTIGQLFGTIRGGLAYAVIFVGALLAATTGTAGAASPITVRAVCTAGPIRCMSVLRTDIPVVANAQAAHDGYGPADLRAAYNHPGVAITASAGDFD